MAERSGKSVVIFTGIPYALGVIGANLAGAAIVFVIAAWLVPMPDVDDPGRVQLINAIVLAVYLLIAIPVGVVWTLRAIRPGTLWLLQDRRPTESERNASLRIPRTQLRVLATLWLIAGAIIVPLNAVLNLKLAPFIAIALLMGLLATCGLGYVLAERLSRGIAQLALQAGVPERPLALGVTSRMMIVWTLSTGVPVLGLMLIGVGSWIGLLPATGSDLERATIFMSLIALSVGLLATSLLARALADPLRSMRRALGGVRHGDLQTEVSVYDGSEIGLLQAGFNEMLRGLRDREHMRDIFSRHVGEDVAAQALEQGVVLGGETREVAVLFIDLVGSTKLAAELPPQEVVRLLNSFFSVVVAVVADHDGSVNKFEGDAALCVFGAPADSDDAAGDALAAARELSEALREAIPELELGIGVSAGNRGGRQHRRGRALRIHRDRRSGQRGREADRARQDAARPRARQRLGGGASKPARSRKLEARRIDPAARTCRRDGHGDACLGRVPVGAGRCGRGPVWARAGVGAGRCWCGPVCSGRCVRAGGCGPVRARAGVGAGRWVRRQARSRTRAVARRNAGAPSVQ